MTRKQKIKYIGKIAVWVLFTEILLGCIGLAISEKIPRQLLLSIRAFVTQDTEIGLFLADEYHEGILGKEEFEQNIDLTLFWLRWAAEKGNADAMYRYAFLYDEGYYVERNMLVAVEYYEKAAQNGHAVALNNLGVYYLKSNNEENFDKAMDYFTKAAEAELPLALTNLGKIYIEIHPDGNKAVSYLRKAEALGDIEATYILGLCYRDGFGVAQSDIEYLRHVYEAAYFGWEPALCEIGRMYKTGELFLQDYGYAIKWFDQSFCGESAYELALMYRDGLGVEEDPLKASEYMLNANLFGYEPANQELDKMLQNRYGIFAEEEHDNFE